MELSEKKNLISSLASSPHGDLGVFLPIASRALAQDADFYAHLIAYNAKKGSVRDAKVALPVLALADPDRDEHDVLIEHAFALLADLNPRMFLKAMEFARTVRWDWRRVGLDAGPRASAEKLVRGRYRRAMRRLIVRYLRDLEADRHVWERTALRHRAVLKTLYAWYGVKPSDHADQILFKRNPQGGPFLALKGLSKLSADEAAGVIMKWKLPFLTIRGAAGALAKEPSVVMAMIKAASPTELVTNTKAFEKLGVKTVPALRAAFEEALEAAGKSKRAKAPLKATRAAEVLEDEGESKLAAKLRVLQEKQLDSMAGIDGNWLVLADKSGSMSQAIEVGRLITATLTRLVRGTVQLVFFDESPHSIDATGKTYEELKTLTKTIEAGGGTSIGCGLQSIVDKKLEVNGIAIVSDGGENHLPWFFQAYKAYVDKLGNDPTVYFYRLAGDADALSSNCTRAQIDLQTFDLRGKTIDHYSVADLAQTMKVSRYGLVDEVLAYPLLTIDDVLERTKGMPVLTKWSQALVG